MSLIQGKEDKWNMFLNSELNTYHTIAGTFWQKDFCLFVDNYVEAIRDFDKMRPGDLTIRTGDIITLVREHDDGYMEGRLGKEEGLFPASYVKACNEQDKQYMQSKVYMMNITCVSFKIEKRKYTDMIECEKMGIKNLLMYFFIIW